MKHYPKTTNKQGPNITSFMGQKPDIKILKIGMASREYNVHHDFTKHLEKIFQIFDTKKCDAILFSLWSIFARQDYFPKEQLEGLNHVKLVMLETFRDCDLDNINHAYYRDPKTNKWEQYDYSQKFGSLSKMKESDLYSFVGSEIPQRIFGNSISLLCGDVPDPYYLDKNVKMVELFLYHKLGLMNKYTHLFGDS